MTFFIYLSVTSPIRLPLTSLLSLSFLFLPLFVTSYFSDFTPFPSDFISTLCLLLPYPLLSHFHLTLSISLYILLSPFTLIEASDRQQFSTFSPIKYPIFLRYITYNRYVYALCIYCFYIFWILHVSVRIRGIVTSSQSSSHTIVQSILARNLSIYYLIKLVYL
jgi:hypothetical protein